MNVNNNAIKRIMADVRELAKHPSSRYSAAPLEQNVFEWHFSIRGPSGTDFEGGTYHGRILLPSEYPFKPPNIIFLTKTGRFEVGTKICLSISAYHEESWQPAWGEGAGSIGSLEYSKAERQKLAKESVSYSCPCCGPIAALLSDPDSKEEVDSEVASQISQLRMASALSPGKGASDAHTAPSADILEKKIEGNEKSVTGDKSAVNVPNMVDTHCSSSALEDTSRCADGIEAKQDFATPAEKSHPVESGDKTTSARVFTEHDIDAFVRERLEEAGCSDSVHKDPACCSANNETAVQDAQDTGSAKGADVIHSAVSDQEGANTSKRCGQSNSSQSTSAIHANIQAEGNNGLLEDTDHQKSRGVDGAIQSPATSTEEAPRVFPDVNTGHGNHHDFTDNVLTALLYIIGALILIIIFRRALLSQLFSANDDPGEL